MTRGMSTVGRQSKMPASRLTDILVLACWIISACVTSVGEASGESVPENRAGPGGREDVGVRCTWGLYPADGGCLLSGGIEERTPILDDAGVDTGRTLVEFGDFREQLGCGQSSTACGEPVRCTCPPGDNGVITATPRTVPDGCRNICRWWNVRREYNLHRPPHPFPPRGSGR